MAIHLEMKNSIQLMIDEQRPKTTPLAAGLLFILNILNRVITMTMKLKIIYSRV
jgi:hypothetical protein